MYVGVILFVLSVSIYKPEVRFIYNNKPGVICFMQFSIFANK